MTTRSLLFAAVLLMAISSGIEAKADLGGDGTSIQKDAGLLGGSDQVTQHPHYTLHEISRNWARVHEFTGSDGKVFALAWAGKKHPKLDSLLGVHLGEFQAALGLGRHRHRHGGSLSVDRGDLHVEMGGHMGALFGKVWLTKQVPAGMDLHDVK